MVRNVIVILTIFLFMASCHNNLNNTQNSVAKVEVKKNEKNQYRLYVNGNEFYVNGAGLEFGDIEALAKYGGNSFRTWRTEDGKKDAIEVLNEANENGLMVLMGLEVGRERHGYSYDDTAFVNKQFNYIQNEVKRLKDHPALLGWAIGNELNLGQNDLKIYKEVNRISQMIHEIDPNHITTTTTAGIGKREVDYINEHCTDIDFISIQMYGDIVNLQQRINDSGWEGPYMVTEWGATGHWEVGSTDWGAPIEQSSQEKAHAFMDRYKVAIKADSINCLGSYVFLWAQKQERTPTWYGMFLEDGSITEPVDAMKFMWTGQWPEIKCPTIDSFKIENKTAFDNIKLHAASKFNAEVFHKSNNIDSLKIKWEILPESTDLGWGGDFENRPTTLFSSLGNSTVELVSPKDKGAYRLFVYVIADNKYAATANIPFMVTE